ncbi:MAG: heme-binding domain-containing protein [Cytophagaceae bacterium]|nr:heme-binding domain-containing protein [Cytophagaceae bacterium]
MLKKIIFGLIILLVLIQFIRIDKTNPPVDKSKDFITLTQPSDEIKGILVTSCYDCHSNETNYPWYTNVAPLSWWLKNHINEGREHLNFSEWATYTEERQQHKLDECIEEVHEGEMPLSSYTIIMHKDAALSPAQKDALNTWIATLIKKKQ